MNNSSCSNYIVLTAYILCSNSNLVTINLTNSIIFILLSHEKQNFGSGFYVFETFVLVFGYQHIYGNFPALIDYFSLSVLYNTYNIGYIIIIITNCNDAIASKIYKIIITIFVIIYI